MEHARHSHAATTGNVPIPTHCGHLALQAEAAHKQQEAAVEHARDLERELRDAWQEVQTAEALRQRDVHQAGTEAARAAQAGAEDLRRTRKELTGLARELTECRVRGCPS